jgi:hypothetical protein
MNVRSTLLAFGALVGSVSAASAVDIYHQRGFTDEIYRFDTNTATNVFVGNTLGPGESFGMSFAPSGTLYAHDRDSQSLFTINTGSGYATLVGVTGLSAEDFTVNLAGTAGYSTRSGTLYQIDLDTGAASALGVIGVTMDGLTIAPSATVINGTAINAGDIVGVDSQNLYRIDPDTLAVTALGATIGADETIEFAPDATLYGIAGSNIYVIDKATLVATDIGDIVPNYSLGMAIPRTTVDAPEPATLALLGVGLVGLAAARRRRA